MNYQNRNINIGFMLRGVLGMQEIITLEQFRDTKTRGTDFIAITDKNLSKNCVHHTRCSFVREHYFVQKVLSNGKINGSYYFTNNYKEALQQFEKMSTCKYCFK
jgi:hypothetical protein